MNVVDTLTDYAASQIAIMVDNGWMPVEAAWVTSEHIHDLVDEAMEVAEARRRSRRG